MAGPDIKPEKKKTAEHQVKIITPTKDNSKNIKEIKREELSNTLLVEKDITSSMEATFFEENEPLTQITQETTSVLEEEIITIPVLPLTEEEPISVTGPVSVIENFEEQEEIVEIPEQFIGYKISKMPDVFSPNNDGVNDYFFVISEGLTDYNLVVLNSRNETVFQSQNPDFKWDGNGLNGEPVEQGKYVYFLIAKDGNNNVVNKHSLLTIVR